MTPHEWILSSDTGTSSKTIWAVMMGAVTGKEHPFTFDIPHDPDDFGRCYRLLKLFPEWNCRLGEVAEVFPKWGPMVREWDNLVAIYERDHPTGRSHELFERMQQLEDEGFEAAGWRRTSSCGWEKCA